MNISFQLTPSYLATAMLTVKCRSCNHMNFAFSVKCKTCLSELAITIHDDSDSSDHAEASPSPPKLSSLLVQRTPAPRVDTRPPFPAPDGQYWAWVDTGVAGMGWAICTGRSVSASKLASAAPAAPSAPQGAVRGAPQGTPQRAQRGQSRSVVSVGQDSHFDCAGRGI